MKVDWTLNFFVESYMCSQATQIQTMGQNQSRIYFVRKEPNPHCHLTGLFLYHLTPGQWPPHIPPPLLACLSTTELLNVLTMPLS